MHRLVATGFQQQWLAVSTPQRNEPASGGFDAAAAAAGGEQAVGLVDRGLHTFEAGC
jgi:hypothetical protein